MTCSTGALIDCLHVVVGSTAPRPRRSDLEPCPRHRSGPPAAESYAANFADLHPPLSPREARVAAERCLFCYDAPCLEACPTSIDIPLFIRQIATGNPLGSAQTILDANILGGMCARVCPTETLCEEVCVRETSEGKPVEIGRLQRYATDTLFATGRQLYRQGAATGHGGRGRRRPRRPRLRPQARDRWAMRSR